MFALTTSSLAGEATAAKNIVARLVKTHALTFAEVSPYGNELALNVMRSFWSIAPETPAPAKPNAEKAKPTSRTAEQTLSEFIDQLRREQNRDAAPSHRYADPYYAYTRSNPWDVFGQQAYDSAAPNDPDPNSYGPNHNGSNPYGSNPYGRPAFRPEPPLSVEWQGKTVPVTELGSDALSYLILDYEGHREWVKNWKDKAHDAIEEERFDDAVAYLTRIQQRITQQKSTRVTKAVYEGLVKEAEERIRRRSTPRWSGGFSGPSW